MKLSTWRSKIVAWVSNKLVITSWDLTTPEAVGQTVGFLPPLRNIRAIDNDQGITMNCTQDIYVTTRYSFNTKYHQLPMSLFEGTYSAISQSLIKEIEDLGDIKEVTLNYVEQPIRLVEDGERSNNLGDWLVTLVWSAEMTLIPDPEPEIGFPGFPGYNIEAVKVNLWRELLDGSEDVLDQTMELPK